MNGETRGWKNNNPLNLDYHKEIGWLGLATPPSDGRFARFTTLAYGLRAGIVNARVYKRQHGIKTLGQYMSRFAPLGPENSAKYHDFVAQKSGHRLNDHIDLESREDLEPIMRAQISYENGTPLNEVDIRVPREVWDAAFSLAKPMSRSKTVGGAVGAAAATVAGAVVEVATQNAEVIVGAGSAATALWPKWAPVIAAIVALCFIGVVLYARLSARSEGIR